MPGQERRRIRDLQTPPPAERPRTNAGPIVDTKHVDTRRVFGDVLQRLMRQMERGELPPGTHHPYGFRSFDLLDRPTIEELFGEHRHPSAPIARDGELPASVVLHYFPAGPLPIAAGTPPLHKHSFDMENLILKGRVRNYRHAITAIRPSADGMRQDRHQIPAYHQNALQDIWDAMPEPDPRLRKGYSVYDLERAGRKIPILKRVRFPDHGDVDYETGEMNLANPFGGAHVFPPLEAMYSVATAQLYLVTHDRRYSTTSQTAYEVDVIQSVSPEEHWEGDLYNTRADEMHIQEHRFDEPSSATLCLMSHRPDEFNLLAGGGGFRSEHFEREPVTRAEMAAICDDLLPSLKQADWVADLTEARTARTFIGL
jgi:hypothetical protein